MPKYFLLLLLLTPLSVSSDVLTSEQICLPSSLFKEIVKEEREREAELVINTAYIVIKKLCSTKGFIYITIKGKKEKILCYPSNQI